MNIFFLFSMFFIFNNLYGQVDEMQRESDTFFFSKDSVLVPLDSLRTAGDTLLMAQDSLALDTLLSVSSKKLSPNAIEASVKYISQDSIIINLINKKIFLFTDAKTYYEDIELTAGFMEFGFVNSELYASGVADSCGHIHEPPVFKQADSEFCSQEIIYNFKTKKGKVTKVITNEGEGYIHGHYVKYVEDKTSYIKGGQYTTCNLEHPHFQIRFNKGKVIQDEKIVTGPAYLSFGNIPSPLALPFTYVPIQKERSSGIVLPHFGSSGNRGFYFQDFGYYFGINDNFDLQLSGDIYTRGSWAAKAKANYVFRYKCNGTVELTFSQTFEGEIPPRNHKEDYRVYWKHNQDSKSHPTTRFNAHVNVISQTFNNNNLSSTSDYLSNQFNSSVNFSSNIKGVFNFDAAVTYSQNTSRKDVNLTLPSLNMSVVQFYPFRKKFKAGKLKWYDNISLRWESQMTNQINTIDSLFFKPETWQKTQIGIKHRIPLQIPIKMGKFNWNTNVSLDEKWYLQRQEQEFGIIMLNDTTPRKQVNYVFQRGFWALHDLNLSTSLTTKIYATYYRKKGVAAIRHVMTPDLNFTFRPNLSNNTYGTYFNTLTGEKEEYSYFEGAMYGGALPRMQAITSFTLNNNIELKVRSKKDTITGTRKISIFDNLAISCGYDFAADSLNWRPLSISGRTSLFSFLDITFGLAFDPYIINKNGRRVHQTEAKVNHRAMRLSESNLNIGLNWRLNRDFFKGKKKNENTVNDAVGLFPDHTQGISTMRPDFNNPWNITLNYSFYYNVFDNLAFYILGANKQYDSKITQTVNIAADVSITRKWKIDVRTGYSIQEKKITFTEINIYRDLHCWEMKLGWVPFGDRRGWNFKINVKASVLQDLKYEMRRDFWDNY
ncbi:MAG: hypothetical protein FWC10_01620 [Lentimicrobiaceae bacterium]|nr:hypothetical protein [Lentimicrobiaceae bacterium]